MKKIFMLMSLLMLTAIFTAGCNAAEENDVSATAETFAGKKILVAYFSRTGENYEVGNITKGNTHIVADLIAETTGADTFEIKPVNPYPTGYKECTEVAKQELAEGARPELATKIENMEDYDVIFIGYPIWWGDMPMPVYTFLEKNNFSGKIIIPFSTAAGSGLSGTDRKIAKVCTEATVLEGLSVEGKMAQKEPDKVKPNVINWLVKLGFSAKK